MHPPKAISLSPALASAASAAVASVLGSSWMITTKRSVAKFHSATPTATASIAPRFPPNCFNISELDNEEYPIELHFDGCLPPDSASPSTPFTSDPTPKRTITDIYPTSQSPTRTGSTTTLKSPSMLRQLAITDIAQTSAQTSAALNTEKATEDIEESPKLTIILPAISIILAFIVFAGGLFWIGYHPSSDTAVIVRRYTDFELTERSIDEADKLN
jgi:hypothetical protein